eukprot:1013808-Rhodomonas_salina.5
MVLQIYSWGRNDCGQLGSTLAIVLCHVRYSHTRSRAISAILYNGHYRRLYAMSGTGIRGPVGCPVLRQRCRDQAWDTTSTQEYQST